MADYSYSSLISRFQKKLNEVKNVSSTKIKIPPPIVQFVDRKNLVTNFSDVISAITQRDLSNEINPDDTDEIITTKNTRHSKKINLMQQFFIRFLRHEFSNSKITTSINKEGQLKVDGLTRRAQFTVNTTMTKFIKECIVCPACKSLNTAPIKVGKQYHCKDCGEDTYVSPTLISSLSKF